MKKQTAVEWLVQKINHTGWGDIMIDIPKEFIEQAKAMEKDQIIKAAIISHFEGVRQSAKTSKEYLEYGEQYYTETFEQ